MDMLQTTCYRAIIASGLVVFSAGSVHSQDYQVSRLEADARRTGLRVLNGDHLTLVTDRPTRKDDGIRELPVVFDQAFDAWCNHFNMDPEKHSHWKAFGCLIVERERFREVGLLPENIPDFSNGFCDRNRFWIIDQSNPNYRRHLMLHEGVHAFTISLRQLDTPAWYTEGLAEMLATHRLEKALPPHFIATPIPVRASDVEQLGRIEEIQRLRATKRMPSIQQIFSLHGSAHGKLSLYASTWATVAMLSLHPRYSKMFSILERGSLDQSFTNRLTTSPAWDFADAIRDFDAFTDDIDYGYDFRRSAVDWTPGTALQDGRHVEVLAGRGWQNSGIQLQPTNLYSMHAQGRVLLGHADAGPLESEPQGISLAWHRRWPVGRLLAAQWAQGNDGDRPRFVVLSEGTNGEIRPLVEGPLFLKVNESPGQLADSTGRYGVHIKAQ